MAMIVIVIDVFLLSVQIIYPLEMECMDLTGLEISLVSMYAVFDGNKNENGKMDKDTFLRVLKEELPFFAVRGIIVFVLSCSTGIYLINYSFYSL